jgi:nitrate reductase NapAB chaperone NapD
MNESNKEYEMTEVNDTPATEQEINLVDGFVVHATDADGNVIVVPEAELTGEVTPVEILENADNAEEVSTDGTAADVEESTPEA